MNIFVLFYFRMRWMKSGRSNDHVNIHEIDVCLSNTNGVPLPSCNLLFLKIRPRKKDIPNEKLKKKQKYFTQRA